MNVLIVVCSLSLFTHAAFFGKLSQLGLVCIPIKDNSPSMSLTNIRAYTLQILKWLDRHFKKGRVYSWALLVTPYIAYEKQPVYLVGHHSVINQEIKLLTQFLRCSSSQFSLVAPLSLFLRLGP
jgi:hypothetical protein